MKPVRFILLIHVAATLMMAAITWFAQIVHYPLLGLVGTETFVSYQTANMQLTTLVVGPLILGEGVTAGLLVWRRPPGVLGFQVFLGLGLLGVIWVSTAFLQVPMHHLLITGFDASAHQTLVISNWIRTFAWSARGFLVLWMVARIRG